MQISRAEVWSRLINLRQDAPRLAKVLGQLPADWAAAIRAALGVATGDDESRLQQMREMEFYGPQRQTVARNQGIEMLRTGRWNE